MLPQIQYDKCCSRNKKRKSGTGILRNKNIEIEILDMDDLEQSEWRLK